MILDLKITSNRGLNMKIIKVIFTFDPNSFKKPDIFIEENQILKLGHLNITPIHSPGHSPGSVCHHIANVLFSGDVLFYRTVGRN